VTPPFVFDGLLSLVGGLIVDIRGIALPKDFLAIMESL
jgi:hypothetical protein